MTMSNVIFKKLYPKSYTTDVSTRVSNALLVGKQACLFSSGLFLINVKVQLLVR